MMIVSIFGIHSNFAMLEALHERDHDYLWGIGNMMDYGPKGLEVVQWMKRKTAVALRGNHDHTVGRGGG